MKRKHGHRSIKGATVIEQNRLINHGQYGRQNFLHYPTITGDDLGGINAMSPNLMRASTRLTLIDGFTVVMKYKTIL